MQPIIAGEIFVEWYWGPIFLAIFVGVPLLAVCTALDVVGSLVARRRGLIGPRSLLSHAMTVVALFAGGAGALYAEHEISERRDFNASVERGFAAISFPLYEPASLPPGYRLGFLRPVASGADGPRLIASYEGPAGRSLYVTQQGSDPRVDVELPLVCDTDVGYVAPGSPLGFRPPSCRPRPTPGGRDLSVERGEAVARLGTTRVSIRFDDRTTRADVEAFVDALQITPERDLQLAR